MAQSTGGGFGYTLLHTAQLWRTEAARALAAHELTVPQFLLLMQLYRRHRHGWLPLSQAEVSAQLGMDANTTSQVTRALERRGLVERARSADDARAWALTLTARGLQIARGSSDTARAVNDLFFGALSPAQREALGSLLESLTTASEQRS